jgi:signal transduction histidine kinase
LSNLVTALAAGSESLKNSAMGHDSSLINNVCDLTRRLAREIVLQRLLMSRDPCKYRPSWQIVDIVESLAFLQRLFCNHPVAASRRLTVEAAPARTCVTDASLLERILTNMLMNAFEATAAGGEVKLSVEASNDRLRFTVWNRECMTPAVRSRVFQRYFSTKGTYAIRLLGESMLKGKVGFTSSEEAGTTFFLELPCDAAGQGRDRRAARAHS